MTDFKLIVHVIVIYVTLQSMSAEWSHAQFFDEMIKQILECYNLSGVAMSIVKGSKVIYRETFGFSDYSRKIPFSKNQTTILVASLSKSFTALLINYFSITEKFEMTSSINYILSKNQQIQFMSSNRTNMATFEDLLAHRMAIKRYDFAMLFGGLQSKELLQKMRYIPAMKDKNFRTSFAYSNIMYVVAEKILERYTNKSFNEMMHTYVFAALNLTSTTLISPSFDTRFLAKSASGLINQTFSGHLFKSSVNILAACGVITTLDDMVKWQRFLTTSRFNPQNQLLNRAIKMTISSKIKLDSEMLNFVNLTVEESLKKRLGITFMEHLEYGEGWFLSKYRGFNVIWHGGSFFGLESNLFWIPELDLSVFIHVNAKILNVDKYDKIIRLIPSIVTDLLLDSRTLVTNRDICNLFEKQTDELRRQVSPKEFILEYDFSTVSFANVIGNYQHPAFGEVIIRRYQKSDNIWLQYYGKDILVLEYGTLFKAQLIKTKQNCKIKNFFVDSPNQNDPSLYDYFGFYLTMGEPFWFLSPLLVIDIEVNLTVNQDTCQVLIQKNLYTNTRKLQMRFLDLEIIEFIYNSAVSACSLHNVLLVITLNISVIICTFKSNLSMF